MEPPSNDLIEFSSASGVVYVSIDQKLYMQSFKEHIKVWVILNDLLQFNNQNNSEAMRVEEKEGEQVKNCVAVNFKSLSSYVVSENSLKTPTDFTALENLVKSESPLVKNSNKKKEMQKRNLLRQRHDDLESSSFGKRKRKRERITNVNMKSAERKKCELDISEMKARNKETLSSGTKPCLQKRELCDDEMNELERSNIQTDVVCEFCSKAFKSQQEFYDHRKARGTEHTCEICHKVFPFKAHLIVHMSVHNDHRMEIDSLGFDPLTGDDCKLLKSSYNPKQSSGQEILQPDETIPTCEVCGVQMTSRSILKTHMMLHTGEKAYKCCVCNEQFNSIGRFTHHMATHRRSGKVQCKICNIGFESRSELSKHQLTHEYKCGLCGAVFPNKTSRAFHYKMFHKEDILRCPECDKLYSSETELKLHLKYHRNRSKTQCTICGRFVSRLNDHMLSHSNDSEDCRIYVCDKCPKQFKQKLCFQRHLRTHSEEKHYACVHCPKRFAKSGGLSRHMLTHTQEKPFICPVCGKACTQMGNLRNHMQIHNKDSGLLYCSLCCIAFSDRRALQEHLKNAHVFEEGSSTKCIATAETISIMS